MCLRKRNDGRKFFAAILVLFLASCGSGFDEQMALLEKYGISQRDCGPSVWFHENQPELFEPGAASKWLELATPEANAECTATRRLVEEVREKDRLFRRYRCKVRGQDVEVSFSSAKNDRDSDLFDACEFAYSGDKPFEDSKRYTAFRDR